LVEPVQGEGLDRDKIPLPVFCILGMKAHHRVRSIPFSGYHDILYPSSLDSGGGDDRVTDELASQVQQLQAMITQFSLRDGNGRGLFNI